MKTKEELNALKNEVDTLNKKLAELSEEELKEVTGGFIPPYPPTRLDPEIGYKDVGNNGQSGWDEPKYILGAGGIVSGMQMSTESKPVEYPAD